MRCPVRSGGRYHRGTDQPIVEACPTARKDAAMSLLHSFYWLGSVAVVVLSTVFFQTAGLNSWRVLALLWAAVPVMNAVLFSRVPILALTEDGQEMGIRGLLKSSLFWLFIFIMVCAGASEQAMSQWASAFAESGLMCQRQWEIWPDLVCFQFSWAYPGQCMPDTASASVSPPL